MLFLLSEKLYHINVICVTDFSRKPNIFLSNNFALTRNYDTVSWGGEVPWKGGTMDA
jgi:hypothetical protein